MPAVSKKQQKLMGMVHAVQKGEMTPPSKEVAELAKSMKKTDSKEYAKTKHKGLPEKKKKKKKAALTIESLVTLANDLDQSNLTKFADQLDTIIKEAVEGQDGEVISLMPHLEEKQFQEDEMKFEAIKSEIKSDLAKLDYLIDTYLPNDEVYLGRIRKILGDAGSTIYSGIKQYRNTKQGQLKALINELLSSKRISQEEAEEYLDPQTMNTISTVDLDQAVKELALAYKLRQELPPEETEG